MRRGDAWGGVERNGNKKDGREMTETKNKRMREHKDNKEWRKADDEKSERLTEIVS